MNEPWKEKSVEVKLLDGGGQGYTFLVKGVSGGTKNAVLKLLKPQKAQDPKRRRHMYQEVANLKILHSAGGKVPEVLDGNTENFEDINVSMYFVMGYIEGSTLANLIKQSDGLPVETWVGIIAQGSECSIYRDFRKGQFHEPSKPADSPTLVLRFQGDSALSTPDAAIVVADMDKAVSKAITIISQKIQNLN
jgi:hypothetical protein